jgi:hypothetical protein
MHWHDFGWLSGGPGAEIALEGHVAVSGTETDEARSAISYRLGASASAWLHWRSH